MTIFTEFQLTGDLQNQAQMEKYMRHQFPFAGVRTPERKQQAARLIRQSKQVPLPELLAGIDVLYRRPEREYQYVAIDVSVANVRRLSLTELTQLTQYVTQTAWWDSVDSWRKLYGEYVRYVPEDKLTVFALFYQQPNLWMRRISILLQLLEKQTLDRQLLTQAIEFDATTDEFFIQKAIGWALRDFSKYDADWVRTFMDEHALSALAVREGSKYL